MSSGLANLPTLAGLALSLKNLDTAHVYAQTIPVVPAPSDPAARVVWSTTADEVWTKLRKDKALTEHDQAAPTTQNDATTNDDQPSPSDSESASATPTPTATPDPKTGLITQQDGSLLDPNTGGIVDPQNGTIRDANTGQYIGIADRYLNATVCAVPAQK